MNKRMLAELLAQRVDLSYKDAGEAIDQIIEIISTSIHNGVPVSLRGFGTFSLRHRAARMVNNRFADSARRIPDAMVPCFRPSRNLRNPNRKPGSK
jgi:nucleoid DNA-binding protein